MGAGSLMRGETRKQDITTFPNIPELSQTKPAFLSSDRHNWPGRTLAGRTGRCAGQACFWLTESGGFSQGLPDERPPWARFFPWNMCFWATLAVQVAVGSDEISG
jgi:hypothetical protein